jgi:hypothetical protein
VQSPCDDDALAGSRNVVAVLRLVIDTDGELSHGQVVTSAGPVAAPFQLWEELVPALRRWLAREGPDEPPGAEERRDRTRGSEDRP